jgi:hypothetical protein
VKNSRNITKNVIGIEKSFDELFLWFAVKQT